jgi:hypothetical protein
MAPDAVVTEWLPAASRGAPDAASRAPSALAALNYVAVLFPTLQGPGRLGSVAARRPVAVVASGCLVVRLLRCRVTIDDQVVAHDSRRRKAI